MPLSSRETRQLRLTTYIYQTIYRVPDVLPGGDEDAGHDQDHHCGLVVEPEHIVINADRVKLQELEEATEYVQHSDTDVLIHLISALFIFSLQRISLHVNNPIVVHDYLFDSPETEHNKSCPDQFPCRGALEEAAAMMRML